MKYAAIAQYTDEYPVSRQCEVLEVSESGYYAWRSRPPSQRDEENAALKVEILKIWQQSRRCYGVPRILAELRAQGQGIGRHRVARLMRELKIQGRSARKRRPRTTQSDPAHFKYPNVLKRNFAAEVPNRKWLTDITYIPTTEGWLYVAGVMDVFSRRIVGLAMDTHMHTDLVERALLMAITERQPSPGLLHHSDQGSQYTSWAYTELLHWQQFTISMSRKGQCLDNAPMESFWATLKRECVDRPFDSLAQAHSEIFGYIMGFYNRQRRHSVYGSGSSSPTRDHFTSFAAR
jgi:putative transposase